MLLTPPLEDVLLRPPVEEVLLMLPPELELDPPLLVDEMTTLPADPPPPKPPPNPPPKPPPNPPPKKPPPPPTTTGTLPPPPINPSLTGRGTGAAWFATVTTVGAQAPLVVVEVTMRRGPWPPTCAVVTRRTMWWA